MKNIIYLLIILALFQNGLAGEWRGIKPLFSTREDVEKTLGNPMEKLNDHYKLKNQTVFINYSNGKCSNSFKDYNVPKDTVLSITVYSDWIPFSKLEVDTSKFKKIETLQSEIFWYVNEEDGIRYELRGDMVTQVTYLPSTKDDHLLCPKPINKTCNE